MRNKSLRIHASALGGYTLEGPYTRKPIQKMRRTLRARVALLLALLVAGCGQATAEKPPVTSEVYDGDYAYRIIDHETGCQYVESTRGGVTPRLTADGKPMCGKGA